ncbi:MAG: phosphopantetheine-binding protein [Kiritimatiellia bacterium]
MNQVLSVLQEIRPECKFETVDDFFANGMLDSFDVVTLVATLDRTFGISIDGVDIIPENFKNLDSITTLLRKYGVQA